jgi:nucleotidyltransferase substrate binding protein (TIGR01987 family)
MLTEKFANISAMTEKKIDLKPLASAIDQLQEAIEVWIAQPNESILKRHLRSAVIQSFEFTYELSTKMLRRTLINNATSASLITDLTFNDLLRKGADAGFLDSVNTWRIWRDMRNATSHTYDENKAAEVASQCAGFLTSAKSLLAALQAEQMRQ